MFCVSAPRALGSSADDARNYYDSGLTFSRQGEPDKAIESLKKAVALNPQFAEAYYSLGFVYNNQKGDPEKAIEMYTEALRVHPRYAAAYCNMGVA